MDRRCHDTYTNGFAAYSACVKSSRWHYHIHKRLELPVRNNAGITSFACRLWIGMHTVLPNNRCAFAVFGVRHLIGIVGHRGRG